VGRARCWLVHASAAPRERQRESIRLRFQAIPYGMGVAALPTYPNRTTPISVLNEQQWKLFRCWCLLLLIWKIKVHYRVRKIPLLHHVNSIHVYQCLHLRSISKLSYHKHTRPIAVALNISRTARIKVWVRIPFGLWRYFGVFAMSVEVQALQCHTWPFVQEVI
jgi:hypothetical protein